MLFNSHLFVFFFFPVVLLGFALAPSRKAALSWVSLASLIFYGYWNPRYLALLLCSLAINYALGRSILNARGKGKKKLRLIFGITLNLSVLGYFKYAGFAAANFNSLTGAHFHVPQIALPLALSFITFQKIAFLVDCYRGQIARLEFRSFLFFVTFFPQLIAGPIVHYRELEPQTRGRGFGKLDFDQLTRGTSLFLVGLFKKSVLADSFSAAVGGTFDTARWSETLGFLECWRAALGYALQIYFDFSGYSSMALGLALCLGIRLPVNFQSPYLAVDLVDFWKRWHMTLSRFLRDYLYIPLGGNRKGSLRRYLNLITTMLLGGLWHGAGWGFVFWGALHGVGLCINHAWTEFSAVDRFRATKAYRGLSWLVTFGFVVFAWVPFRADTLSTTKRIWKGMLGLNGGFNAATSFPDYVDSLAYFIQQLNWTYYLEHLDAGRTLIDFAWILLLIALCLLAPTAEAWAGKFKPRLAVGIVMGAFIFHFAQTYFLGTPSEFIYFNF